MKRRPYQQYSREFKVEAIRLVEAGDKTATQVARGWDIRVNHLDKWKLQREREAVSTAPAHSPVDRFDGSGTIDPDTLLT